MKEIEFFFDFASPYAYLAHCRLPALADEYGYGLTYKPIDLFAAKQAAGNSGPSSPQIPMKFQYILTDLKRWAQIYGVPIVRPLPKKSGAPAGGPQEPPITMAQIDSARAHKGMFLAIEFGRERDYAVQVWRATWGSGGLIGDDEVLRNVALAMGWSPDAFFEFVNSDKAERLYQEVNDEAHRRGVFGVPIMIAEGEMWWGNDRLPLLEEYLGAQQAG